MNVREQFGTPNYYHYLQVEEHLKMAYLDVGNAEGEVVLLLHGEPNYSYVYRDIAPSLAESGFQVIVPDLIGFGYSDKPPKEAAFTYSNHTKWLRAFMEKLDLKEIRLFAHDWGAMISLRIIAEQPERFDHVAISYGYLYEGDEEIPESFEGFKKYAQSDPTFSPGDIMNWGTHKELPDSIKLKYDEPFKKPEDFYAARKFPSLIPIDYTNPEATVNRALNQKLENFEKPFITIWGDHPDPMWIGKDTLLRRRIPGAKNQTHYTLEANHFIQEDQPEELTRILVTFFNQNKTP